MLHLPYRELPVDDPGAPDTGSPFRYLGWLARHQKSSLSLNAIFGIIWMVAQALVWAGVGAAIDHGVERHNTAELFWWVGVVIVLGLIQAVSGSMRHQLAVTNWMNAAYRTVQVIGRHIASTGPALTDEIPAGDVVNTVMADAMRIGNAYDSFARFAGAIVAWIVVSFILLSTSVELGLVVLLGVPILGSLTVPLMKPLHRSQAAQREAAGRLAALASDTVAGLRILRGVGGEDVFFGNYQRQSARVRTAGNRVAAPQAGLESGQVLLPAILTGIVTFLGARDVMNGTLQPGELVAFFGYSMFLTTPLRTAIDYVINSTRAYVGASKVLRLLAIEATVKDPEHPLAWPVQLTRLEDRRSGLVLARGQLGRARHRHPRRRGAAHVTASGVFVADSDDVFVNGVTIGAYRLEDVRSQKRRGERDRAEALFRRTAL